MNRRRIVIMGAAGPGPVTAWLSPLALRDPGAPRSRCVNPLTEGP